MKEEHLEEQPILVYCVVRYGRIIGCYIDLNDAVQVQKTIIAKGHLCDLVVKPLL